MKKLLLIILICGVMILGLTGCFAEKNKLKDNDSYIKEQEIGNNEEHSFTGIVIEINEGYIIVKPNENEKEKTISDKIRVENKNEINYKEGEILAITYIGEVNTSYPAQIEVTNIYKIESY